jgi:hypothetical protein
MLRKYGFLKSGGFLGTLYITLIFIFPAVWRLPSHSRCCIMHVPSPQTPCAWSQTWLSPQHSPSCSRHIPPGFVPLPSCCLFLRLLSCGRCMPGILSSLVVFRIIMRLCTSIHSAVCLDCFSAYVREACLVASGTSSSSVHQSGLPFWVMDCGYPYIEAICFLYWVMYFYIYLIFATFFRYVDVENYCCACV